MRPSGTLVLNLPTDRRHLADLLGTRPETVWRAMRELETAGVLKVEGRRVIIRDLDRLLDQAGAPA